MNELKYLERTEIKTRPGFNPRHEVDTDGLLASVREHGILVPLTVTRNDDGYYLLAGERRFTAAILADLEWVPVLIREPGDTENVEADELIVALSENLHRKDLTAVEEAHAIKRLQQLGYSSVRQLATKLGFTQKRIKERIVINECPPEIQESLHKGELNLGTAPTFASIAAASPDLAVVVHDRLKAGRRRMSLDNFAERWPDLLFRERLHNPDTDEWEREPRIPNAHPTYTRLVPSDFDLPEKDHAKLQEIEDISPYGFDGARLNESDIDAARAFGALIEVGDTAVVANDEWLTDRLISHIIPRELKAARKAAKDREANPSSFDNQPGKMNAEQEAESRGVDVDVVKAERKAQRDEEYEARVDADRFNREFGEQLFERLNEVSLDSKEIASMLVGLVLRDGAGDVARCGLTYVHPAWREDEELKNGRTKTTFVATQEEARERLATFVSQARTPEEILGRLCQVVLASEYADSTVVPRSRRNGRPLHPMQDSIELADRKITEGTEKLLEQLTPKMRKEAAERRKARDADRY